MWIRLFLLALLLAQNAFAGRVALVIGNAAYKESPLKNPVNDARDMSVRLKELGFSVITKENLKRKEIPATLKVFRSQIKPGDDVLFFYAGHGLQVKGINYLPAVDAEIGSEDEVDMESLSLNKLLELLDESKAAVKLVFLDACRNNPYARSFRSADRGLSRIGTTAPSGTLISFATKPGSVAADGNGKNGLYTEQLLKHISAPNTPIELVIKNVVRDVKRQSSGAQEPWMEGSLDGDFYFKTAKTASLVPSLGVPSPVLPGKSGVDFGDIEKAQQQWAAWQQAMQADFDKAAQFNGAAAVAAWNRFLQTYASDNPYSGEDERLRSEAQKQLAQAQAPVQAKVATSNPLIAGRFLPLGDGAEIKDQQTGLVWQRCAEGMKWNGSSCTGKAQKYTFDDAQALAGNGWRVPTREELASLFDKTGRSAKINAQAFPATAAEWFWTSSTYANNPVYTWRVPFFDGEPGFGFRTESGAVRLVKGEKPAENQLIAGRYLPLGDGSEIKDTQTGLIWQRCAVGMSWNGQTCTGNFQQFMFDGAQKLAGNGWRVPDKDELASIVDKSRMVPAINMEAFPATPSEWFWSSSANEGSSSHARLVNFYGGGVGGNGFRTSNYAVRLVRAGQ